MKFTFRTNPIDVEKVVGDVTSAVRAKAEQLTKEFKNRITATIYQSVRRRTGTMDRAIKPFVISDKTSVTLGFDIDVSEAPHIMTHMMMTREESPFKTIYAKAHLLTIPLNDYVYGRSAAKMTNLEVVPVRGHMFLAPKRGHDSKFKPMFILEHSIKIPKRIKMYDIMDTLESTARREIQKVAQTALDKSLIG